MGRRGPRPTPTAILQARGSRRAGTRRADSAAAIEAPVCPEWLRPEAKAEWKRIEPLLIEDGLLTRLDLAALACYCSTWADFVKARADLEKFGRTITDQYGVRTHPAWTQFVESARMVRLFIAEFGLSPASRRNVSSAAKPQGNPLAAFARGRDWAPDRAKRPKPGG